MEKATQESLWVQDSIRLHSGNYLNVLKPDPDKITIEDIAHALSHQPRFAGHTKEFYSVAQHSVWVSEHCSPENKMEGLLHDASEAFLCDIPSPIKPHIPEYIKIETTLMIAVALKFKFNYPLSFEVKKYDREALEYEWQCKVLNNSIYSMTPKEARRAFIAQYKYILEEV
jgi:5'-deoxynucleotidase YfbR-like HD superfamily hydrolase